MTTLYYKYEEELESEAQRSAAQALALAQAQLQSADEEARNQGSSLVLNVCWLLQNRTEQKRKSRRSEKN